MFVNNPEGRTKILVTHALHFLPRVDYIYTIADGRVIERGAYTELMDGDGAFSRYVKEFGSKREEEKDVDKIEGEKAKKGEDGPDTVTVKFEKGRTIMQVEERNIGAVTWEIYKTYLSAGNGYVLAPALLLSLLLMQSARVMSSYWLVFWQEQQFHRPVGFYVRDTSPFLRLLVLMHFVRWGFTPPWESP